MGDTDYKDPDWTEKDFEELRKAGEEGTRRAREFEAFLDERRQGLWEEFLAQRNKPKVSTAEWLRVQRAGREGPPIEVVNAETRVQLAQIIADLNSARNGVSRQMSMMIVQLWGVLILLGVALVTSRSPQPHPYQLERVKDVAGNDVFLRINIDAGTECAVGHGWGVVRTSPGSPTPYSVPFCDGPDDIDLSGGLVPKKPGQ